MTMRNWTFDGNHSSILFIAQHMVVARVLFNAKTTISRTTSA